MSWRQIMLKKYSSMVSMQAFDFQGEANVAVELVKPKSDVETARDFPAKA